MVASPGGLYTQTLEGDEALALLSTLTRAIREARIRDSFPSGRRLQDLLDALAAGIRARRYRELLIDTRTGLPNLAAVTRVATDRELAMEGRLPTRAVDGHDDGYGARLCSLSPIPVDEVEAKIRRYDAERDRVDVQVQVTKLDGTGRYVRITAEFAVTGQGWGTRVLSLDDAAVRVALTQEVETMVYRHASFDAELLFARLQELSAVEVRRVERGIVGPIFCALPGGTRTTDTPDAGPLAEGWDRVLDATPTDALRVLLVCQSDLAGTDVARTQSNDPLAPLLEARVSPEEVAPILETRTRLSLQVYRDAKFVATSNVGPMLRALMEAAGTRNVVRITR